MKTLIAAAALAAVVATPALAQSASRRAPVQADQSQYDESYGRRETQRHSNRRGNDVYENGHYLGTDPDPNVRFELRRDAEHDF
jgi:hypothetical protein